MSKFAQNCGFWPPEANTANTFRLNLACQRTPYVYCLVPNLAWISKGALLQEPPECKNSVEIAICMLSVLQRLNDIYGF